jgi:hypothetical protein
MATMRRFVLVLTACLAGSFGLVPSTASAQLANPPADCLTQSDDNAADQYAVSAEATLALTVSTTETGATITISGSCWGAVASVVLNSTPVVLATDVPVDDNGDWSLTFTVPCDVEQGDHTITVNGEDVLGDPTSRSAPLTIDGVNEAVCESTVGTVGTPSPGEEPPGTEASGGLPFTGSGNVAALVLLGMVAIVIGTGLAATARRRRGRHAA